MDAKNNKNILSENIGEDGKKKSPKLESWRKNYLVDIDGVICEDIPNEEPKEYLRHTKFQMQKSR